MNSTINNREFQKYVLNIVALYKKRPDLKVYLEMLLSIITVVVLIVFAIKPTVITIAGLFTKISALTQTSKELDTKIRNLEVAQSIYNANQQNITLLTEAVPDTPNVGPFALQVRGAINKESLSTINIFVDKVNLGQATDSGKLKVTTSVSGNFASILSYIKDLEFLRRPTFIEKLDLVSIVSDKTKTINLTTLGSVPYK